MQSQTLSKSSALIAIATAFIFFSRLAVADSLPDFSTLAQENSPAVVNIGTTLKKTARPGMPKFEMPQDIPEDSPLYDFFRRYFGEGQDGGPDDGEPHSSLGSGFIISKDGYVVSNYHVVKDADEIVIRLSDKREFNAKVVGTDERSDLAVLKIEATDLPVVRIGKALDLKVGEWVLAIGSPFGFDHSVTAGIVSAKGRALPNENYVPFIQTDVAINPGNSGGPLINLAGEVVGMNSQIYSRTGGFMGLSFAIPMEVVMNSYNQIRDKGSVSRGWLGILIQDVTRELAESFGMKTPHGALVSKVLPNSPAASAGIKAGDILLEFNAAKIEISSDLPPLVGNTKVGEKAGVKVLRNGETKSFEVQIAELPADDDLKVGATGKSDSTTDNRLGLAVKDLTEKQRDKLEIEDHGVLVEHVKNGAASKAGIHQGDVILQIDNEKVKDAKQFKEIVAKLEGGKSVPVLVQRRGSPTFLAIKVPEGK
jgi:serine protease Do